MLGVPALLGRTHFDTRSGDEIVLSFDSWHKHYGGDPQVLGRLFRLNDRDYTIIGVMPSQFAWDAADAYTLLESSDNRAKLYSVVFRLRKGARGSTAAAEVFQLIRRFVRDG